jgi:hypothetical protein
MQHLFSFDRAMRVEKTFMQALASQLSSTLIQYLFSFDLAMRVEKTFMHANSRFSTLMQHLFSFDLAMRVEKTFMQALASQLSSTLILVSPELQYLKMEGEKSSLGKPDDCATSLPIVRLNPCLDSGETKV